MLVPLHVKSHYSLGYGTASVRDLVGRAGEMGLPALALTDLENLYGQIKFHHLCRHRGLRPITGVELRPGFDGRRESGDKHGRLVLLARDRSGYESICRIVSRRRGGASSTGGVSGAISHGSGRFEELIGMATTPRDPMVALAEDLASAGPASGGLFILADDPPTLDRLLRLDRLNPACLGVLIVRPTPSGSDERLLIAAARSRGIRLVADPDVVMLDPADYRLHVLQIAIRRNETIAAVRESGLAESADRHLRQPVELASLFRDLPQAVEESQRIAESCELDLRHTEPVLPILEFPSGETAASHLKRICRERLERRRAEGGCSGVEYDRRLREELTTIEELGFSSYFLVVGQIVAYAREQGIQVAGRGSAAGSLVAHLLRLTDVDPVAHGLLFERLMHARRRDLPDIDIDVCSERRDELIEWVHRRFGRQNVAMVGAHATFRRRSAYREGLKAVGLPLREVENFCRRIPPEDLSEFAADGEGDQVGGGDEEPAGRARHPRRGRTRPPAESLAMPALPERYRSAGLLIERLVGTPRYFSVHPGGVVIADRSIDGYVPLELAAKGVVAAQYDMHSIQHVGLIKIDLLGNHCLTELQETLDLLGEEDEGAQRAGGRELGLPRPAAEALRRDGLRAIPQTDPQTLATLDRADTIGCFQFESPAMRSLLAQIPIRNLHDCIAALALVRPGAASGDAKQAFIRRANGEEVPEYLHPALEERLKETHGILLYEEDIMYVLSVLGGISLVESDELRAAINESQTEPEELKQLEAHFLRLAGENGIEARVAQAAWQNVLKFASYSFSKAHAASYGLMGYQATYMKTHFPLEFGCAVLNHHGGMYPLRTLAAAIGRWGVTLLPPSVNRSEPRCTIESSDAGRSRGFEGERAIRIGLEKVKRLSRKSLAGIVRSRRSEGAFRDLADLLERLAMSRREVEALVLSGSCDDLPPLSQAAYPFVHEAVLEALRGELHPAALQAVSARIPTPRDPTDLERMQAYRSLIRIKNELNFLEMHVSDHPMRVLRSEATRYGCVTTTEAASRAGSFVRVAGIIAATRRVPTKDRGVMQFVTVEDEEGVMEAVIFPPTYRSVWNAITTPGPFLLAGTVQEDYGDVHLVVTGLYPFHERSRTYSVRGAATP